MADSLDVDGALVEPSRFRALATLNIQDIDSVVVELNRPNSLNAIDATMTRELESLVRLIGDSRDLRSIILTGAGRAFCAGADTKEVRQDVGRLGSSAYVRMQLRRLDVLHDGVLALWNSKVPIITVVNGPASGAGCALALLGTTIIGTPSSYLDWPFLRLGLPPDLGSLYLLAQRCGWSRAERIALHCERLSPDVCRQLGAYDEVLDEGHAMDRAYELAELYAKLNPVALKHTRELRRAVSADFAAYLAEERAAVRACLEESVLVSGSERE